jgi:hypothetical protein
MYLKSGDTFAEHLKRLRSIRESNKKKSEKKVRRRLTADQRASIFSKTDGRCHVCGGKIEGNWHADHVLAHSVGGEHSPENYLPAHPLCNNYRWDYHPEEFQWILKLGVWVRTQIEKRTVLGKLISEKFIRYERTRLSRSHKNIVVRWQEFEEMPRVFGHGVEFYIQDENKNHEFVAFLDGYEWYHGSPKEVTIKIRKASDFKDPRILDKVRRDIESAIKEKRLWQGEVSQLVFAWLNG